ncbi:uncharacterized protein LOC119633975 isoform X1 [Glossina fuscipes]|uniref:Uncharacterized protein LOC119633975 isoform X1 n=1 Tax=Glossina fuscipes TaxID=7396 RepID=A0A8U0WF84_9MUSC|nr:uncharacterized protein LOC119633975 isoform X1 [Glossina fuscipes]XP_037883779.1 uncharacterized protein LOC119633975 isoform X1 [Glossina fuscipes]
MDILKKMFQQNEEEAKRDRDGAPNKDEFRKPQWFEEAETDDELFDDDRKFAFQVFTNPLELQKHFESQMQQILEAINELESMYRTNNFSICIITQLCYITLSADNRMPIEKNLKEEYLKPGFESKTFKEFEKQQKQYFDTDLDGEIFADQLHSLIQRFANGEYMQDSPQTALDSTTKILPRNDKKAIRKSKPKLTDEEIIMGRIHGTLDDGNEEQRKRIKHRRPDFMNPMSPVIPRGPFAGGAFDGHFQGPKMFSQSVMTKTVRKPDGSYETTKITQDSQGNKTITTTRTKDGKSETVTTYDDAVASAGKRSIKESSEIYEGERNIYLSKEGYALPRNLW